jgi:thiol-disulfide isomerase/thioredoxin
MRKLSIILLMLISITASAQKYSIKTTVKGLPQKEIYLADFYGDKNTKIDSVMSDTTRSLLFMANADMPAGMYRVILDKNSYLDFIYNNEDIEMETEFNAVYDSLKIIKSVENKEYFAFLREGNDYRRKFDLLAPVVNYFPRDDSFYDTVLNKYVNVQMEFLGFIDSLVKRYPGTYASRIIKVRKPLYYEPGLDEAGRRKYAIEHYFDNVDFTDVELVKSNVYTTLAIEYLTLYSNPSFTQDQLETEFIKAVDKIMYEAMDNNIIYDFIVDYLVGGFERYHFDKVLDYIAENYTPDQCENEDMKSDLQTRLQKYAELAVGKKAPDITIPDTSGKIISLDKIKSKYTLVLFWASWCPHCTETLPEIFNLYENSISRKNLEVLAISLDGNKDEWLDALHQGGYNWLNGSDLKGWDSQAAVDYNVYATPTMFLLDKNQKIVAKPVTFQELKQALININILE